LKYIKKPVPHIQPVSESSLCKRVQPRRNLFFWAL
jgi:hypothetical protein